MTPYDFLVETYETEILKVLGVWSMFDDADCNNRPRTDDHRARNLHEHMVHQCVSENIWFSEMLDIHVSESPLPDPETRIGFIKQYARDATARLKALRLKDETWWKTETGFFDTRRSRAWIMVRRIAHTAHHRGQQTTLLRVFNRDLHSTYGPTADTGGLMQHHAPVVYAYPDLDRLLQEESCDRTKAMLPGVGEQPSTERP